MRLSRGIDLSFQKCGYTSMLRISERLCRKFLKYFIASKFLIYTNDDRILVVSQTITKKFVRFKKALLLAV